MNIEFIEALNDIEKEKGIKKEIVLSGIEQSIVIAYKKNFGTSDNLRVHIDEESGEVRAYSQKIVTDDVLDPFLEISLEDAHKINKAFNIDDVVEIEVIPKDFGRISAQTAKQVVLQKIREAERELVFKEFSSRQGDILTGIIQRVDKKNIIIDMGKIEAILLTQEQVPNEEYKQNMRIKTYITEVKQTTKGPEIYVSRAHPGLIKRLFEMEVPEVAEGIIEIKSISREPGMRTKIAVYSKSDDIDPIGSCIGQRGIRVQAIVDELQGEKLDIIKWSMNPVEYICNSLNPAEVINVDINEEEKVAKVIVPDNQLSLAIGKEGQNARLAAKLTGWKIDIKSETQNREIFED